MKGPVVFTVAVAIAVATAVALLTMGLSGGGPFGATAVPPGVARVVTRDGRVIELRVEVADTPERRARGLMGRRYLDEEAGMLFVFPEPTHGAFWMKDTLIPLSIAFLGEEGEITAILDMEPCAAEPCPRYRPPSPYVAALEVRRGWFRRHGVAVGDRVEY